MGNILTKNFKDRKLKPFVFSKWSMSLPGVPVRGIRKALRDKGGGEVLCYKTTPSCLLGNVN